MNAGFEKLSFWQKKVFSGIMQLKSTINFTGVIRIYHIRTKIRYAFGEGGKIMKKKMWGKNSVLCVVLTVMLVLTGCGASEKSASADSGTAAYLTNDIYSTEMAVEEEAMADAAMPAEAPAAEAGTSAKGSNGVEVQDTQRKLIKNVNLEVETEEFDVLLKTIEDKTENLGGYIEESYTYNGSSYYGNQSRNASLTIRVPAQKLDAFLSEVAENSNIISKNNSVTDVTLQYVDMDSHKKALQAEQKRLLELMEQAETMEDIITLESRLSDVRYQIESMEAQLRTFDNQVNYSTIYLNINEVTKLTPVKEQTTWEKISTGFVDSLYSVGKGLLNFGIGVIINLPYLVVWAIVIVIVVFIIKGIRRVRKNRKHKKEMKALQAAGQNMDGQTAQKTVQE